MKKIFIVALLTIFTATIAFEKPAKSLNRPAYAEFNRAFYGAKNVVSVTSDYITKYIFTLKGKEQQAFYSNSGEYLGVVKTFAFDKLPENALAIILKKYSYPKYELKECVEYKDANGNVNYYLSLQKKKKKDIVLQVAPSGKVSKF